MVSTEEEKTRNSGKPSMIINSLMHIFVNNSTDTGESKNIAKLNQT